MEYFSKYDHFPCSKTNCSIDRPLLYAWGFTMPELSLAVIFVVGGFYTIALFIDSYFWVLGFVFIFLGYLLPKLLKNYRLNYPAQSILHKLWLRGLVRGQGFLRAKGVFGP